VKTIDMVVKGRSAAIVLLWVATLGADATIPRADKPGSKDSPLLERYQGSFIVAYEHKGFDQFTLPLSKLNRYQARKTVRETSFTNPNGSVRWRGRTRGSFT